MVSAVKSRDKWGSSVEFVLSCLGYAVGLGNVWRFPYMCGANGGAAFMIPYIVMMIFAGFPIFYMELALGQYSALAPHILYGRMSPIFTGLGYAMLLITSFKAVYYNMILAYVFYYFGASFNLNLPWADCSHEWNDLACRYTSCFNTTHISILGSHCYLRENMDIVENDDELNYHEDKILMNILNENPSTSFYSANISFGFEKRDMTILERLEALTQHGESPAYQYYYRKVLERSNTIEEIGGLKLDLVICLFTAWFLIFLCLIKGIKSSGKVVYFTATFPYAILFILLIRGLTLDGAIDGVLFYVNPDPVYLLQANTWGKAAGQIFFSLALGYGGLTTLASYNQFHNNFFRDTLIVVLGDCATSILTGFVVFPIIGFIAKQTGKTVAETAAAGTGLVFIAYADAVAQMPMSPFWAVLFFFMLIILAMDTMIILVETVITAFLDHWPTLRQSKYKVMVDGAVCFTLFCIGLIFCTPGGSYVLTIVDSYAGGWTLLLTCFCELIMVIFVYGYKRLVGDICLMLGKPPNLFYKWMGYPINAYWYICWIVITPVMLGGVIVFNCIGYKRTHVSGYDFPVWADLMGWTIALFCISPIPIAAVYKLVVAVKKGESLYSLLCPTDKWKPAESDAKFKSNLHVVIAGESIAM